MTLSTLAAAIALATIQPTGFVPVAQPPITMAFADTEVGQVLRALSLRTHTPIVYTNKDKLTVTITASFSSVDEAIRQVTTLSGLVYREVDNTYIVAPASNLRQAIEPYGHKASFELDPGTTGKAQIYVQDALPYTTVRAVGDKLVLTGTDSDISEAKDLVDAFKRDQAAQAQTTRTIDLRYLTLTEATTLLKSLLPDVTLVGREDQKAGSIVASGPAAHVSSAVEILTKLDVPSNRNTEHDIVYKVYNLRYVGSNVVTDFVKKAAPEVEAYIGLEAYSPPRANFNPLTSALSSGSGGSGSSSSSSSSSSTTTTSSSAGGTAGPDHKYANGDRATTVVLKGTNAAVENVLKLIRAMDVKPKQLVIQVNVLETTPSLTENLGLDWNLTNTQTVSESTFGASGVGFGTFTRTTPATFTATLNAALSKGEGRLIANPKVQVLDNDDADVFIGQTIYTQVSQATGLGGQTVSVQAFNIGIILLIRPRIDPDGNISMHVNPVVSTLTSITSSGLPQTASREAETTVIIKDGQTVVIGGLIREDDSKTIDEVPFLSKIPILGALFRNRNSSKSHQDVIVSITPHIIEDKEAGK